jgi:hypothetical protein
LAVRAVRADVPRDLPSSAAAEVRPLDEALNALGEYLGKHCFPEQLQSGGGPTQYDSPSAFAPDTYAPHVQAVTDALGRLTAASRSR